MFLTELKIFRILETHRRLQTEGKAALSPLERYLGSQHLLQTVANVVQFFPREAVVAKRPAPNTF